MHYDKVKAIDPLLLCAALHVQWTNHSPLWSLKTDDIPLSIPALVSYILQNTAEPPSYLQSLP